MNSSTETSSHVDVGTKRKMDDLTLKFAEQSTIRMIKQTNDLNALKEAACNLVSAHYAAKRLIGKLLLESMEKQVEKDIPNE